MSWSNNNYKLSYLHYFQNLGFECSFIEGNDDDMNSYNHYAYGSVADWVFGVACGIQPAEPGYAGVRIEPHPDPRLNSLGAVLDTVHGRIRSFWKHTESGIRYEIDTPVRTEIVINGKSRIVEKGRYLF